MKSRLWLIVPWVLFLATAAGWAGYWTYVASQGEAKLAHWAHGERARGAEASYSSIVRRGFPVLMRLEIRALHYAPQNGGWRADTARADLNIDLLAPVHVIAAAAAPIVIARADGAVTTIEADAMIASFRTQGGALAQAGIEADNLRIDDPAKDGVLAARKLVLNVRPDPRARGDWQLAIDITGLALPRPVRSFEPFGQNVALLRGAIVAEQGGALFQPAPGDPPGDPLGPWREAGGTVRFENLELHWGPLEAQGAGQAGLDAQRRLQGHLELPIEHPAPVLSALSEDPHVEANARTTMRLLAASYRINGRNLKLDVDAQNGVLSLEGFALRTLPPVY